jgi:hypothetical protein
VQAGTALSWRIRYEADNSVNLVRYDAPGRCEVQRWDYDPDGQRFESAALHELSLATA